MAGPCYQEAHIALVVRRSDGGSVRRVRAVKLGWLVWCGAEAVCWQGVSLALFVDIEIFYMNIEYRDKYILVMCEQCSWSVSMQEGRRRVMFRVSFSVVNTDSAMRR